MKKQIFILTTFLDLCNTDNDSNMEESSPNNVLDSTGK